MQAVKYKCYGMIGNAQSYNVKRDCTGDTSSMIVQIKSDKVKNKIDWRLRVTVLMLPKPLCFIAMFPGYQGYEFLPLASL
jgi:hypothetical protein